MSSAHENLVILLHGVGSNGADFAGLGKALQGFLPDAAFAPPNAPNPFDGGGLGRQWFSVVGVNAANRAERVEQARAGFDLGDDRVLRLQQIGAGRVELFGPEVSAAAGVDELGVDPHPIAARLHRAFENIAHAQILADRLGGRRVGRCSDL